MSAKTVAENQMKEPLISVIVPVYMVEPWLERCVDSIRNQTYTNLEIILVDDGSPDRSGEMCDAFAHNDERIRVIHQDNGGLSASRNSGLGISRGEYIGFVDSDDLIHPEMYSRLYADIVSYGTRLAFCQPLMCTGDSPAFPQMAEESECLPGHEVILRSLQGIIWFSAWTKLYHRSLFEGIRFPEGRINEDYPVTMRIFDRCDRIAVNYNRLYAYIKREGSITTSRNLERSFDQIVNAEDVFLFIKDTHPDCSDLAARILMSSCLGFLLKTDGTNSGRFDSKRKEVISIIRKYFHEGRSNPYMSPSQKILVSAAKAGLFPYTMVSGLYRAMKGDYFK